MQKRISFFLILFSILNIYHAIGQVIIQEGLMIKLDTDSHGLDNDIDPNYWFYWHFSFSQTGRLIITIEYSDPEKVDFYLISPEEINLPEQIGSVWHSQVYFAGTSLTFANKKLLSTWESVSNSDGYTVYCYFDGVILRFRVKVIYEGIDHFFVECTNDTIAHSQKTYINAEARDIFDQKVSKYEFTGNIFLDVKIDDLAKQYGKLDYNYLIYPDSPTYEADDMIRNVHYYNLIFDYIYFIADKQLPEEIQDINVTVMKSDDSTIFGTSNFHIMDEFHYFQFSLQEDTLSYLDTTTFFIQALDINDEEYPLPLNTSLDFCMDFLGEYITGFINSAGEAVDSLKRITYEHAKMKE